VSEHKLLGMATTVAELFAGKLPIHDLYGPEGAHLYHNFTLRDTAEIDELLDLSTGRGGSVLELACGSGRITLPFLRNGFRVVGLDSSPYMLGLLADRMREPDNQPYAGQLSTVDGDMTAFALGRRFPLIVLGATAIWNLDEAGRAALFARIGEHLTDDGRFLMTVLTFAGLADATAPLENVTIFTSHDRTSPVLCTLIDYVEPGGLRCTNILSQRIVDGTVTNNAMYSAWSYLTPPAALAEEISRAGLRIVAQHEVTGRHQITRNNTSAGRQRLLFEVALAAL
jgi:SAM-dependent methyltransferase